LLRRGSQFLAHAGFHISNICTFANRLTATKSIASDPAGRDRFTARTL
jgi:hypothetical protein